MVPAAAVANEAVPAAGLVEIPGEVHEDAVRAPGPNEGETKAGGEPDEADFALPELIDLLEAGLLFAEGPVSFISSGPVVTEPRHQEPEKPD